MGIKEQRKKIQRAIVHLVQSCDAKIAVRELRLIAKTVKTAESFCSKQTQTGKKTK